MPKEFKDISADLVGRDYAKIRDLLLNMPKEQINDDIKVGTYTSVLGKKIAFETPLQIACSKYQELGGDLELIKSLIKKGADVNASNDYCGTVLGIAAKKKSTELVNLLIEHRANVNLANMGTGLTPLMIACRSDDNDMAMLLINKGADVKIANKYGITALHFAVGDENVEPELIKLLIKNGANVNAVRKNGETVIMNAVQDGNIETIKLLLKNLAEIDSLEDDAWQKIFKWANDQNKTEGVKYIKEFQNHQGLMPLLYQSKVGKDEKKRWPTDLIRKAHHTLTGNDAPDPQKPQ